MATKRQQFSAVFNDSTTDDDFDKIAGGLVKGGFKAATTAFTIPTIAWSAVAIAGGITLAVTTGGAGLMALGAGAAAVGAARTYSRINKLHKVNTTVDTAMDDILNNKAQAPAAIKLSPVSKLLHNPVVKLVTSAALLGAGLALVAGTAGAILPLALGAALIASGSLGVLTGGLGTIGAGLKLAFKGFSRKKKAKAAPPVTIINQPIPPELLAVAPAGSDVSAQQAFTAAAKDEPATQPQAPAVKPVICPQPPKAA